MRIDYFACCPWLACFSLRTRLCNVLFSAEIFEHTVLLLLYTDVARDTRIDPMQFTTVAPPKERIDLEICITPYIHKLHCASFCGVLRLLIVHTLLLVHV